MSNFLDLDFSSDFTSDLQTDSDRLSSHRSDPFGGPRRSAKRSPHDDKFRVLLTGKNQRISVNIADHLEKEKNYKTTLSPSEGEALLREVDYLLPHVIIICLGNENSSTSRDYDVLLEYTDPCWLCTIVVADKEDYKVFKDNSRLDNLFFLPRPVSMESLYSKLEEIELRAEKELLSIEETEPESDFDEPDDTLTQPNRKRILIVDDDPEQLMQIKLHLSAFYEVRAVRSGPAALSYLKEHPVDLILLDYMMPDMDGPSVLKSIRESGDYPWIPVIFLTGMTEKKQVIKTLVDFKPEGYIVKPAKKSDLVAKIIDVLG